MFIRRFAANQQFIDDHNRKKNVEPVIQVKATVLQP